MSDNVKIKISLIVGVLAGMSDAVKDGMPYLAQGLSDAAETLDGILDELTADEAVEDTDTNTSARWMSADDIESTKKFLRRDQSLSFAFPWVKSPDGRDYWDSIDDRLKDGFITDETPICAEARTKLLGYLKAHGVDVSEFTEPPAVEIAQATADMAALEEENARLREALARIADPHSTITEICEKTDEEVTLPLDMWWARHIARTALESSNSAAPNLTTQRRMVWQES